MTDGSLWLKNGKIIVENGVAIMCKRCPCECEPRVIVSLKVYGKDGRTCFNLRPYQGKGVGTTGNIWRAIISRETSDGGILAYVYTGGRIDDDGVLVGLRPGVCFAGGGWHTLSLQEGCYENGHLIWLDHLTLPSPQN